MTGFGKENRCCVVAIMPVATYIGMGHMCMLDRFKMLHAYYLTDASTLYHLTQFDKIGRIAEHMTYSYNTSCFFCEIKYITAFLFRRLDRFFQQYIIAHFQCLHTG